MKTRRYTIAVAQWTTDRNAVLKQIAREIEDYLEETSTSTTGVVVTEFNMDFIYRGGSTDAPA